MINQGVNVIGNPNKQNSTDNFGATSSLTAQIDALNRLRANERGFEEELNRLKVKNAEFLERMQLDQITELTNAYMNQYEQLLAKQLEDAKKKKEEEINALWEIGEISREEADKRFEEEKARLEELSNWLIKKEQEANRAIAIDEEKRRKKEEKNKAKTLANDAKSIAKLYKKFDKPKTKEELEELEEAREELYEQRKIVDKDGIERYETEAEATKRAEDTIKEAEVEAKRQETQASYDKLMGLVKQLNSTIDTIAGYKSAIDTRLHGSKQKNLFGSYWELMSANITSFSGASILVKQSKITERVASMVEQGIAFNVEQRAGLQELASKIATTFDATNGTLLRLVRIQQQDTTAGRLGMEAALNEFLNNMYETTEYMGQIANGIKSNIEEAMSMMTGEAAVSFEYQVQKWLGSLYSVGMSDTEVSTIGNTLGQIAAGQLEGLTSGGASNLLIMAANSANIPISSIMSEGLNASTTNELLNAMVEYLAKIYNESKGSKVVQQQFANVFGLTASDLKAVANLAPSISSINSNGITYNSAMKNLNSMTWSAISRTSVGEMMTNLWENLQYTMSAGVANNPALYATWKVSNMLDELVGGIPIPMISVMGNTVDLHTTVADLMKVASLSGGILSGMGKLIAGLVKGAIGLGSGMHPLLGAMGIYNTDQIKTVTRGDGSRLSTAGGASVSESGSMTVGNSDGNDVKEKTMSDANDDSKSQMATASEESEETKLSEVNDNIINIYRLLSEVVDGTSSLRVKIYETVSTTQGNGII